MELSTEKAFEEYEELKLTEKRVAARLKELQPMLLKAIPEGKEVAGQHGVFAIRNTSTWKYSQAVTAKAEELDKLKDEEKAKGIAEKVEKPTVFYTVNAKENGES